MHSKLTIQSDLSLVENSANAVMEQMQSFTVDTPLPAEWYG